MAGVTKEQINAAKQMSAIEFLKRYRPGSLVRSGRGEFQLQAHDSFKINENSSVWHWKSRDIGGKSALDYLIYVESMDFVAAVETLCGEVAAYVPTEKVARPKPFILPPAAPNCDKAAAYLRGRGISDAVIDYCARAGIFYESLPYHSLPAKTTAGISSRGDETAGALKGSTGAFVASRPSNCVFIGLDENYAPKYAALRGIYDNGKKPFKIEQGGSDKSCGFCIPPNAQTKRVAVYESAIDAMAHMSLERSGNKYRLSLGGIYAPKQGEAERSTKLPAALERFLANHPEITELELCLDNDYAGRYAAEKIEQAYESKLAVTQNLPTVEGMDYGELARQTGCCAKENQYKVPQQIGKKERMMQR